MPKVDIHCKNSKERTGEEFRELHEWMDDPQKELGVNHRTLRHDLSYISEVKKKFGIKGVREFLRHIAEDYKYTADKWGKDCLICGKPTWHKNNYCNFCKKNFKDIIKIKKGEIKLKNSK